MLQGSLCDVIQPTLGLHRAELDHELQKLQLHIKTVFMTRHWFSHDFRIAVQECLDAMASLVELCGLMQRLLAEPTLTADFDACVTGLQDCLATVDRLQADVSGLGATSFSLRADQVASILLLRSFERLCAAAEDRSGALFNPSSDHYDTVTGCMRYTDVIDVIDDMKKASAKTSSALTPYFGFVTAGRKMFFHGTQRDITLALLFCTGAADRLMQYLKSKAAAAPSSATSDELLRMLSHLQLCDESSLLGSIAHSQTSPRPSDPSDLAWLRTLLWPASSAASVPKVHDVMCEFGAKQVLAFCTSEFFHVKNGGSLVLPAADTAENKFKRCNLILAAVALSSVSLHPAIASMGCIDTVVSAGSSLVSGKRAPEQRDAYFTGRVQELSRVCEVVQAVLLNSRPASTPARIAVLGVPGVGKSLLVSQALLKMQKTHADKMHDVYFLKLRGRGAASVEEDLVMYARSLGSKIGVAAGCPPSDALNKFKGYLSLLRYVAIIDDANADGLQAAARWIPVSSGLQAVLVTSQQPLEELMSISTALGAFETMALSGFDESTSVELLQRLLKRCVAMADQAHRLRDVAGRLEHLPLGVRLFGEWSQARYHRDAKPMNSERKAFTDAAKCAAVASGLPFDEAAADLQFRSEYLAKTGCDETGIAQRIFDDWASNADIADTEVLQSNDKYPRGLFGTVRLALHDLDRLDAEDAKCSRQLLSILALCPPINTPWSLFLGHDGSRISDLDHVTHREGLERIAAVLLRSGLVQVQGDCFSMHQLLQRAVRREVAGGVDAAAQLIDGRVGGKDLKAADVYREMLPAAYHVVKEVRLIEAARSEWCRGVRQRIAGLMEWLGGGALEVEIRRAIVQ